MFKLYSQISTTFFCCVTVKEEIKMMWKSKLEDIFRSRCGGGGGEKVKRAAIEAGQDHIMKLRKKSILLSICRGMWKAKMTWLSGWQGGGGGKRVEAKRASWGWQSMKSESEWKEGEKRGKSGWNGKEKSMKRGWKAGEKWMIGGEVKRSSEREKHGEF